MKQNRYPIFIPSKGRWKSHYTVNALRELHIENFRLIIEDQEYDKYLSIIDKKNLLVLDKAYQRNYETCDELGLIKSVGSGAARNFAWDVAKTEGYEREWTVDDNIMHFCRLNRNQKLRCYTPAFFLCMEDFVDRYTNIAMAGPAYTFFCATSSSYPPFTINTRIYSCNLIKTDLPFHWRGRYNEDTILSLDMIKAGYCTLQFYAFLQDKAATLTVAGGNTTEIYGDGTYDKSKMLVDMHPDCSSLVKRYGRWHHYVDYDRFKNNKLILKKDISIPDVVNNYGMKLIKITKKESNK